MKDMLIQEQPLATNELSTSFGSNHDLYFILTRLCVTCISPYKECSDFDTGNRKILQNIERTMNDILA